MDAGSSTPEIEHTMSAQWGQALYSCSMIPSQSLSCVPEVNPHICVGGLNSTFWLSVYTPGRGINALSAIDAVYMRDETGTSYYLREICLEPSVLTQRVYGAADKCTNYPTYSKVHTHPSSDYLAVGGFTDWWTWDGYITNAAALVAPECIYDYPNDVNMPEEVETLNGMN